MSEPILSIGAARALHLAAQGMLQARRARATPGDVLAAIRRMGVLQIDTISVVARSPYLVLWSRLGDYDPCWLDALLEQGRLFEYWAHEACFIPVEDYGLYRHRMIDPGSLGWKYAGAWMREHPDEVERVLEHIRTHGPVRSADFVREDGKAGGWWQWKPQKRALEVLFTTGRLMIARRQQFQRVYDLAERVLPGWDDADMPSLDAARRALVLQAVKALGVARAAWIADYHRTRPPHTDAHALADAGLLLRVRVEGWRDALFVHPDHAPLLERAAAGALTPSVTSPLSPFDPIVWDRRRAAELFGFDYRLECYTPAHKRRHGYFTLPLLRRGALVGRVDAKAHRKQGVFELKALALEPGVRTGGRLAGDLASAFLRCARWHACSQVTLVQAEPEAFAGPLRAALAALAPPRAC
ncbi:winged helix-turn-helix domain-containing protein [Massilia forsythiae]|uniref:Winged helix-turn-helix domain-containing protein n=1 Tax=Massilia forsythiae TaxID=2728020 RepID=A0A7Z2ZTD6_9BURK|nr:crosslink repair DNA glycosylase YcaQ family protein [Massilia forsythiae]QJE01481.1 winged helix-turn-helix domain-containing protein [Massilia forsythiae]